MNKPMNIPKEFDDIRPFEPEEMPAAFDRLLANEGFRKVLAWIYPNVPLDVLSQKLKACKTLMDFQLNFIYTVVQKIMDKASQGYDMDATNLDRQANYTFISNHRDIVLDAALLDMLLVDNHFSTTCEIAIGDNLLSLPWVKDVVRLNKAFLVQRSLSPREMLFASKRLSEYMHYAISVKHENIWIAQREGRAKDSNDRTQKAILQMMAMGGEGSIVERLLSLHIVPLAISYEFDPCDFLKAKELQQRRDTPDFHKGPNDDNISMRTGILGFKGHVHYHAAPCLDNFLKQLDGSLPKRELYAQICSQIDREIHLGYRLWPSNYAALDMLHGSDRYSAHYTPQDKQAFCKYIDGQLAKIDLPDKDDEFLRRSMLTMYAYPAANQLAAKK